MASTPKKFNIFIASNEASGDELAVYLIERIQCYLKEKDPTLLKNIRFKAAGGNGFSKANMPVVFDTSKLAVIGILEILIYLPKLIELRKKIYHFCLNWRADLFIGVDSPDFFLPLEKKLKQQGVQIIHFVCPSVYAWRAYRLKKIARSLDLLLGILPFEKQFIENYCQDHQIKLNYQSLTHPIYHSITNNNDQSTDQKKIPSDDKSLKELLKLPKNSKMIALFLGSRKSEIKRHLPVMIEFIQIIKDQYPDYIFVSSTSSQSHHQLIQNEIDNNQLKNCFSLIGRLNQLISECDFSITKSGTITLYLAKAKKPMIIFYRLNWLSFLIIQSLAYQKYVSLVNWSLEKKVFPELIQSKFNCKNLLIEFEQIIKDPDHYDDAFKKINQRFLSHQSNPLSDSDQALEQIHQLILSTDSFN